MHSLLDKILQSWFSKNNFKPSINTTLRPMVYIAGPYAGNEEKNTKIAAKVGSIATNKGLSAFVPHTCIYHNVYGRDEILEERQNGIVSTLSIIAYLASIKDSYLWVIQNNDGTFSPGTHAELVIWRKIKQDLKLDENITIKKYSEWINANE